MDTGARIAHSRAIGGKVAKLLGKRTQKANEQLAQRLQGALGGKGRPPAAEAAPALDAASCLGYAVDAGQRAVLYLEALWNRGNNYLEQASDGLAPVLHFDSEIVLDGRTLERPVNYALLRIVPPEGVTVDARRRPYVVIDPRAGHGPGIGGFKDDSQVGVALRAGHPVYFIAFFREPEPGQTLLDVCTAEQCFVQKVRALHPDSAKPAIVGNCQGGWAAMMLAASDPDQTGPIVINGTPMSYWSGAWSEGEGDNPMRYAGGLLGGSWLASLAADLGNGRFDGAHLVQNFENLNPANSLWDKWYHLYDRADSEPPRFLEFERWWGNYSLMNREEIEWITRNLFVGNTLWSGDVKSSAGEAFDLRNIRSPIILFASMGDNITPPQQAFNWVADIYGSTDEIKARGQVIVGLLHESIGHLGIFVSGKVAQKEHNQIVSVLKSIELLPAGLYAMTIVRKADGGADDYVVEFQERRLEDIVARLNRFERVDEQPFEAVAALSNFNQRAYEIFARPWVQALSNDGTARLLREFHPLRLQNWGFSRLNPWLSWIAPAAQAVRANRKALDEKHPLRQAERAGADLVSAGLDYQRALRDAATEAGFFSVYANLFALHQDEGAQPAPAAGAAAENPRERAHVREALAAIAEGGYAEAIARVAELLQSDGRPLPLSRLELRKELVEAYAEYLPPETSLHELHRQRGLQDIIVRYEPAQALLTLPALLAAPADRQRLLALLDKLVVDPRVLGGDPTPQQRDMLERIHAVLAEAPARPGRGATARTAAGKSKTAPRRQAAAPRNRPHARSRA